MHQHSNSQSHMFPLKVPLNSQLLPQMDWYTYNVQNGTLDITELVHHALSSSEKLCFKKKLLKTFLSANL